MGRLNKDISYPENLILDLLGKDTRMVDGSAEGLFRILQNLSKKHQDMLYMRYAEYLTYEQIGSRLGMTKGGAKGVIRNILKKLRHPSMLNYVRYGIGYLHMLENMKKKEAYKIIFEKELSKIPLSEVAELTKRTYNLYEKATVKDCKININRTVEELRAIVGYLETNNMDLLQQKTFRNAIAIIEKSTWVSVKERLPESCGTGLLLLLKNKYGQKKVIHGFTGYMEKGMLEFHTNDKETNIKVWDVLAWMPLPQPPDDSDC